MPYNEMQKESIKFTLKIQSNTNELQYKIKCTPNSCISYFPQKHGFFCIGSPKSHVDEAAAEESSRLSFSFIKCRPLSHQ